jgi:hypothetical protein
MQCYYSTDGQKHGPILETELKRLMESGELAEGTLVWCEGMSEWAPYSDGLLPVDTAAARENTAVAETGPDYAQLRKEFLDGLEKPEIRDILSDLGDRPYRWSSIFPDPEKFGKKRYTKTKATWLKQIEPLLDDLLFPKEEIRFATNGIFCSFAEQYLLGWMASFINRTAFLFTNYRIIMIHVDSKNRPLQMKWHIPYDQVKKFKTGGLSAAVVFKLKDKTSFTFSNVPTPDRKALKAFIDEMAKRVAKEEFWIPFSQCRDNLCTTCFLPVPRKTYICPNCQETFIEPKKPALMSLCLPCLGDFYLGHRGLGAMEAIGYLVFIVAFVAASVEGDSEGIIGLIIAIAIMHSMDAALTLHMAKKGLVPRRLAWKSHLSSRKSPRIAARK